MPRRLPEERPADGGERASFGKGTVFRVRAAIDGMPDTLSRIGKYIVHNPEKAVRSSLSEVAANAQSGEASVVRFCRQLGYKGFRELKLALAADLAYLDRAPLADGGGPVDEFDLLEDRMSGAIAETRRLLDGEALRRAAERLASSRRIDIFGAGVSGLVAQILAYRLLRIGLVAQAFQDPTLAHEVRTGIDASATAIGVSETGLTSDTENFLAGNRAAGAFTIAITGRPNSPLAKQADIVLVGAPLSPPAIGGETSPSVAKIFLIEALATAIRKL